MIGQTEIIKSYRYKLKDSEEEFQNVSEGHGILLSF